MLLDVACWLICLGMDLIIPAVMILFGKRFLEKPPKSINSSYGYRTSRSMKNQETWDFAHQVCGRIWLKMGKWMLVLSVLAALASLLFLGRGPEAINIACCVLAGIQIVVMLGTIFPVERALKKNFDRFGRRIQV